MRGFQLILGQDDPAAAAGAMAAATLDRPDAGGHVLRKGQMIGPAEVAGLRTLAATAPGTPVSLLALDAEDVDESEAARMLGAAFAGPGVALRGPSQGRIRLAAAQTGLVLVDGARLAAANTLPDISIYTVFGGTPVAAGTQLGEVKITPLAAPRAVIEEAARILAPDTGGPVLEVRAFTPHRAALIVCERLAPDAAERMVRGLQKKLAWFGSTLDAADVDHIANDRVEVASRLHAALERGATLLLAAGGSTSDPADPTLCALTDLGATLLRRGVPIHPGSLLWVAQRGEALIVGVPSCGAFGEQTSLDLMLPRLLALGAGGLNGLERLAEGGLLTRGMDHRFPLYGALE
jgi:molybdenum cofactor cytidylyltransferase